ncbi:uncharacterized protein BDZ99DRAFT_457635 [Mytilinidion resinicola]|uniref:Zinc finger PHD-type domain-containing protein n=1 Tax=Mytilinidion resinicola TaxID=574789 RepID=A0A6A6Z3J7_9PEZI|nr:uncharacterized protein BDZ99DRAFT_457635 [Mytilinidion resinicola]KAF2815656.1 hypothetical protein BDZ99DRAFT_457635 [Mytilinidion resinicola]
MPAMQPVPSLVIADRQDQPASASAKDIPQLSYSSGYNPINVSPTPSAFTAESTVPQYMLPAFVPTVYISPYQSQHSISNPRSRPSLRGGVTRTEIRNAAARVGQLVYDSERDFVQQYRRMSTPAAARAPITPPRTSVTFLPPNSMSPPPLHALQRTLSCTPSPIASLPIRLHTPSFSSATRGAPSRSVLAEPTRKQKYDDIVARLQKQRETDRWLAGEKRRAEDAKRKLSAELKKKRAALSAAKESLTMRDQEPAGQTQPPEDVDAEDTGPWSREQLDAHLAAQLKESEQSWVKTAAARRIGEGDLEAFRRAYKKHGYTFCYCGFDKDGQSMVQCANPECAVGLYHADCLHAAERKAVERQEEWNSALALQQRQRLQEEREDRGELDEAKHIVESRTWMCRTCVMETAQAARGMREELAVREQHERELCEARAREAREERRRLWGEKVRGMHQIMEDMQAEESVQDEDGFVMEDGPVMEEGS